MKINKVTYGNISNIADYKQKGQVKYSQKPAFEGKGDIFVKSEPAKGIMKKIKQVLNFIFPAKQIILEPIDKIDGSDFSKLEGELLKHGRKVIKNSKGRVVRAFQARRDGETLSRVYDYDPKTGGALREAHYQKDGKTLDFIGEYNPATGKNDKSIFFKEDGKTINIVLENDPKTGTFVKSTYYRKDGKGLARVNEYDPKTGNRLKTSIYRKDGEGLAWVDEYDPQTGKQLKTTLYRKNGNKLVTFGY